MACLRTFYLIISLIVLRAHLSRCDDQNLNQNITQGHGKVCKNLVTCVRIGVLSRLSDVEKSEVYPLLGNRLILEKNSYAKINQDTSKMNMLKRAYHLFDTHSARAIITKSFAFKLFRTPQGPFDVALEVSAPTTGRDGRTFFKRRLQMALLPIMYKLGVMSTLLGALVIMVMKGLTIGIILLIFAVASAIKHKLHWQHPEPHHGGWGAPTAPYYSHHPPQDVHVHLHGIQKDHILHREDTGVTSQQYGQYGQQYTAPSGAAAYPSPYNRAAHMQPS